MIRFVIREGDLDLRVNACQSVMINYRSLLYREVVWDVWHSIWLPRRQEHGNYSESSQSLAGIQYLRLWTLAAPLVDMTVKGTEMHTGCNRQDSRMTRDGVKICGPRFASDHKFVCGV